MELDQCDVIEHLIDFTEETAADPVILEEAMHEEEEDSDDETVPQTRKVIKEKSQRHTTYPKPSLYVHTSVCMLLICFLSARWIHALTSLATSRKA